MRVAFIAAGAAGMYCGSCLHDNALAAAMKASGQDFLLVPTYTPLRVDEEAASEPRVFFGAVDIYLQQKLRRERRGRGLFSRLLGSPAVLRWVSRLHPSANPRLLGALAVSMLRGEEGNQRRSLTELVAWLESEVRPQIVHLSNSLLSGMAPALRRALRVPVVASLQGEDLFLEGLPEPHRTEALDLIRERSAAIDRYLATSAWYADHMAGWLGLERGKIEVVPPGISLAGFAPPGPAAPPATGDGAGPGAGARPLTIGYLARITYEKGLHLLAEAFARLSASGEFPGLKLKAAGYLGREGLRYAARIRRALAAKGITDQVEILGTVDRAQKLAFLREIDVLSVPTVYPDPKGLFVLEAIASGVPVVEPDHGAFPELLAATGGGLLSRPGSVLDLADKLALLLRDPVLRRGMGEAGRAAVSSQYSSARVAAQTLEVYRQLAAEGMDGTGGER